MPQYAILIYEKELPGGVADIPPEVMAANLAMGEKITALGARVVNEQALQPAATTRTIEAPDLDTALAIGKLLPIMDGAVEVRPLLEP
jgi:hypothetical protein